MVIFKVHQMYPSDALKIILAMSSDGQQSVVRHQQFLAKGISNPRCQELENNQNSDHLFLS